MDVMNLIESLFRWMHVVAGILWIGLLYFFNWVNSAFAPTMDGETKKKVVPELMPRTLYWFRWGAAYTWVTGVLLLALVYYHTRLVFDAPGAPNWGMGGVLIVLTFVLVFVYDILCKTVFRSGAITFWLGWILATAMVYVFRDLGDFSYRGAAIHTGAMFGTFMAFNVWFRIWPAQQKIIAATKGGDAPDPDLVALAGTRSKHNTYMSVPLVFTMISQHGIWASPAPWYLSIVILFGWWVTGMLYRRSKKVSGF
jgi:uncharacterized membrane protein